MLVAAYRTANLTAWTEKPVQVGLGMTASALFH